MNRHFLVENTQKAKRKVYEMMLNTTNHQGNASQSPVSYHLTLLECLLSKGQK
jgi:hypothetical protein